MKENLKVVISGGGTGGHIFPAIAIADALKRRFPKADILFIGAKGRMEMERVPKAGYPIEGLWISGFTKDLSALSLPFKLASSLTKACRILKRFQPDVVIGVGGFASGPTLKAANWLGIPTVIQEQNSYPGKTNRNVGQKAKAICVAYDHLDQWFPAEKIHFTGNPLRANITLNGTREEAATFFQLNPNKPVALLVGGSQGALGINKGISAQLAAFKDSDLQLIWQTGKTYITQAQEEVKALGLENQVKPTVFIERMDLAYGLAECRFRSWHSCRSLSSSCRYPPLPKTIRPRTPSNSSTPMPPSWCATPTPRRTSSRRCSASKTTTSCKPR